MNVRLVVAGLAVVLFPVAAMAQLPIVGNDYGYPYYYHGYHASTPAESYLTGQARVLWGAGQYNLATSQAMINLEEARSRYFDNQVKYVETYFEKRRLNKSYLAAERGPSITPETAARLSQMRQPERLSIEELDRGAGRIRWPLALQDEEFAPYRMRIETLFAMQTPEDSGINSPSYAEIRQLTQQAAEQLKARIHSLSPEQYTMARSFLDRIVHEARFPVGKPVQPVDGQSANAIGHAVALGRPASGRVGNVAVAAD